MLIVETVYYNVRMIHAILLKNNIVDHDLREHDRSTNTKIFKSLSKKNKIM